MSKRSISQVEVEKYETEPSLAVASFFKGFRAPEDTKFKLYRNKHNDDQFVLHGENERLEYVGQTDSDSVGSSQYVVGVFNKKKNSVDLYQAPVLVSKVVSKSKRDLAGPNIKNQGQVRGSVLRNALGEAFGTKKAKKAISDLERNRVDSDKLADVAVDIVDTVRSASKGLPSRKEMEATVANDRPTPVANLDATDVEQIYPIENIIPYRELQFIRVNGILKEKDIEKKLEFFPYIPTNTKYITKKLAIFKEPSQIGKLQLLYYLTLLLGFYENRRCSRKDKLMENLNSPPETLVDGMLQRFTVARQGTFGRSKDRSFFVDPHNEDKLLCFILVIMLHLDNFIVEISPVAQDIGIKPSKITSLFRIIGCVVKNATVAQAEAFGIDKASIATYKIATLKVPFKLPEMTRRGRATR
ncbi:DNA-directed RNA polymerase I subunit Rpa49p [Monosporozyma servazzii]